MHRSDCWVRLGTFFVFESYSQLTSLHYIFKRVTASWSNTLTIKIPFLWIFEPYSYTVSLWKIRWYKTRRKSTIRHPLGRKMVLVVVVVVRFKRCRSNQRLHWMKVQKRFGMVEVRRKRKTNVRKRLTLLSLSLSSKNIHDDDKTQKKQYDTGPRRIQVSITVQSVEKVSTQDETCEVGMLLDVYESVLRISQSH